MSLEKLIEKYEFLTRKLAQNPIQRIVNKVQQVSPKFEVSPATKEKLKPFDINQKIQDAAPAIAKGLGIDMSPEAVAQRNKTTQEWIEKKRQQADAVANKARPYVPFGNTLTNWEKEREKAWKPPPPPEPIDIGDIDTIEAPAKPKTESQKLVTKFERILKNAQSAQAGDITTILESARYNTYNDVAGDINPILDELNIPAEKHIQLVLTVTPGPKVQITTIPPIQKLNEKATIKLGPKIATILSKGTVSGLSGQRVPFKVTSPVTANWVAVGPAK